VWLHDLDREELGGGNSQSGSGNIARSIGTEEPSPVSMMEGEEKTGGRGFKQVGKPAIVRALSIVAYLENLKDIKKKKEKRGSLKRRLV